jgi:hypothetical protein
MFVPAVATKGADPPSQPQQRKIDSFGTVSRRLPDKTRPVAVRTVVKSMYRSCSVGT